MISGRLGPIIENSMVLPPSEVWKVVLALLLGAAILASACLPQPRRSTSATDLRRLVLSALALYAVGGAASLTGHAVVAACVYAAGITICALAAWLSRGSDAEDPPSSAEPEDVEPPPSPQRLSTFDWAAFEQQFRDYSRRERAPFP